MAEKSSFKLLGKIEFTSKRTKKPAHVRFWTIYIPLSPIGPYILYGSPLTIITYLNVAEGFSHTYASVPLTRVLGVTAEILLLDWSVLTYTCEEIKDI